MRILIILITLLFAVPSWGACFLVMKADVGVNESESYKKGDIVEVFSDDRCQLPPSPDTRFVIILVPGMAKNEALHSEWRQRFGYEVLASNALGYRIRLYSTLARPSDNLGGVTRAQVENFINNHGGSVVSIASNEVVFDIKKVDVASLKQDLRDKVEGRFIRRRLYRVPKAAVDAALANGGVMTYTEAQALNYLKRKSD